MARASLVIMAAGIGSRFGGGIKQLEPVGPNGEIIMDYSIHDALEAGFDKVVFIIRKDLEKDFKEIIGNRIAEKVEVAYAFQELDDIPAGYWQKLEGRTKPWGTGQAVLCCKDIVEEPFMIINADDYYGKEGYRKVYDYLTDEHPKKDTLQMCMAAYLLKNTLSDNGGVTRGVIKVDEYSFLEDVNETKNIVKTADGAGVQKEDGTVEPIPMQSKVSMNMWGIFPDFFPVLEQGFADFLEKLDQEDKKGEYLIPTFIGQLVRDGKAEVKALTTHDTWFGVTYKEDKDSVKESIGKLIRDGVYPEKL